LYLLKQDTFNLFQQTFYRKRTRVYSTVLQSILTKNNPDVGHFLCANIYGQLLYISILYLGDNCIVFENFTASIGDSLVANWVYLRRASGASKRIFATIKSIEGGNRRIRRFFLWGSHLLKQWVSRGCWLYEF